METEEDDLPDGWAGNFDCNDNTRAVHSHRENKGTREDCEVVLGRSPVIGSPVRSSSRTSVLSGQTAVGNFSSILPPGLQFSPEDTLNNDFFFDDEFAVQFDANLSEMQDLDLERSVDIEELLSISNICSEDNREYCRPRISSSKSDSCLQYVPADLSSDEHEAMPDISASDHECVSSSDFSDFRNEPLFSPPAVVDATTSLVVDSMEQSADLSQSLTNTGEKYNFDWRANKNQYIISFDRSPTKCSSNDSSYHETNHSGLTSWAQKFTGSQHVMWTSTSVPKSAQHSVQSSPATSEAGTDKKLTTWKKLKERKTCEVEIPHGMTTWAMLKDTQHQVRQAGSGVRSKSMPDMRGSICQTRQSETPEVTRRGSSCSGSQPSEASSACSSDVHPKRYSASLFELFQRLKSQNEEPQGNEAMISPESLRRLMGTWSMSQVSGDMSPTNPIALSPTAVTHPGLVSWSTVKNLTGPVNLSIGMGCDRSTSPTVQWDSNRCTSSGFQKKVNSSVQTGTSLFGNLPTDVQDSAVQTSIEFTPPSIKVSKSLQTSVTITGRKENDIVHDNAISKKSDRSSYPLKERLSKSLFYTNSALPDLSFLSKGMSQSSSMITSPPSEKIRVGSRPDSKKISCNRSGYIPINKVIPTQLRRAGSTDSRESSPGLSGSRIRSRSVDSASTNSFCSSSSSGIDPGSNDSLNNRTQQFLFAIPRSGLQKGVSSRGRPNRPRQVWKCSCKKESTSNSRVSCANGSDKKCHLCNMECKHCTVPKAKPGCSTCCNNNCRRSSTANGMVSSHPVYHAPEYVIKGLYKKVDYLVSPTRKPCITSDQCQCKSHLNLCHIHHCCAPTEFQCSFCKAYNKIDSQSFLSDGYDLASSNNKIPLKSCLARKREERSGKAMKHRSWSDPYDTAVMVYSENGETKYQLIRSGHSQDCVVHWATPVHTPHPNDLEHKVNDRLKSKLCDRDQHLQPACCENQTNIPPSTSTPPNSPEQEAADTAAACTCRVRRQVALGSSTESADSGWQSCRSKKCVSFSEEVSYHSPYSSPHQSPRKQVKPVPQSHQCQVTDAEVTRRPVSVHLRRPPNGDARQGGVHSNGKESGVKQFHVDRGGDSPPNDFIVSPTSPKTPSFPPSEAPLDTSLKKELTGDLIRGAEVLLDYFSRTRDPLEKTKLGNTVQSSDVGHLVLEYICPAVHALVLDGLKSHTRTFFGKMKNNAWQVVVESAELGPSTRIMHELVEDLKCLRFLNTTWLKFNAFIFGLLNRKALDFWLSYIHSHEGLLKKHYSPTGFLPLSSSHAKPLFLNMITALQPLAQMPFRLEYNFEYRVLQEKQEQHVADYLLDKHVANAEESHIEGQQLLIQQENLQLKHCDCEQPRYAELGKDFLQVTGQKILRKLYTSNSTVDDSRSSSLCLEGEEGDKVFSEGDDGGVPPSNENSSSLQDHLVTASAEVGRQTSGFLKAAGKQLLSSLQRQQLLATKRSDKESQDVADGKTSLECKGSDEPVQPTQGKVRDRVLQPKQQNIVCQGTEAEVKQLPQEEKLNPPPQKINQLEDEMSKSFSSNVSKSEMKILDPKMHESDIPNKGGFLRRLARQFKKSSSADKIYKKDVTHKLEKEHKSQTRVDTGIAKIKQADKELVKENDSSEDKPPVAFPVQLNTGNKPDSLNPVSTNVGTAGGKKPWSKVGPTLINIFDKFLLDESAMDGRHGGSPTGIRRTMSQDDGGNKDKVQSSRLHSHSDYAIMQRMGQAAADKRRLDRPTLQKPVESGDTKQDGELHKERYVQALCHYLATEQEHLSFEKNSVMKLLQETDADWIRCIYGTREGLVHKGCVRHVTATEAVQLRQTKANS